MGLGDPPIDMKWGELCEYADGAWTAKVSDIEELRHDHCI